jgi:hypothetical protein
MVESSLDFGVLLMLKMFRRFYSRLFSIACLVFVLMFASGSTVQAFGALGNEFRVNTTTANNQEYPSIAMTDTGDFVVVWQQDTTGSNPQIYGQRFSLGGAALGTEFQISAAGVRPEVAMDVSGNFVVVWRDLSNVIFQRYNAAGVAQGSATTVGVVSTENQPLVHIAMNNGGSFVIVWKKSGDNVYARLYNTSGVAQTAEFLVGTGYVPRTAMDAVGNFVVTWTSGVNVMVQRYNASGVAQGTALQANTTSGASYSSVGMDNTGNFVVAWHNFQKVAAQRYDAAGSTQGSEFQVSTTVDTNMGNARVAMNASGGFVVSWELGVGTNANIYAQQYNAAGVAQNGETIVSQSADYQGYPIPAINASGAYTVAFMRVVPAPNDEFDVYARRFGDFDPGIHPTATDEFRVNTYITNNQYLSSVAMNNTGNFVIAWQSDGQDGSGQGIYAQRYNAFAQPQGSEFQVNTTTQFGQQYASVAMDTNGNFVIVWTSGGSGNSSVFARRYNSAGVAQSGEITVYTGNSQHNWSSVAMNTNGDFVVVWTVQIAASTYHVYAQRFNAAGTPQGGTIPVESTAIPIHTTPARIAMDDAGNFIVTWTSTVAVNDKDVYARRFNASGTPQGTEFRVNTFTTGNQEYSSIAADNAGNFVVTWHSWGQDGDSVGQYAQRYNSSGVAQGSEFRVNMTTLGQQGIGSVTMDDNGNFVIIWESGDINAGTIDVYARPYDALGVPQSNEFLVNVNTAAYQGFYATVAMNNLGNYVVTYLSSIGGANGQDVYARLFGPPITLNMTISENEFYTAFEQERAAFPTITQGIADFVPDGINMTVTLNTGETGRVNFTVSNADGFVTVQISSITNLSGGAASQNYVDIVSRDLPSLITATLDNLVTARFGAGQDVESMNIDNSSMTLLLTGS